MFTQAGFRRDYKAIAHARVSIIGRTGIVDAVLLQWPTGDIAWGSRTQIVWPERVALHAGETEGKRLLELAGGGIVA